MFIRSLTIENKNGKIIRNIKFHLGLNLIIDETSPEYVKTTGNNVGKTTVLKLIDYCLGGRKDKIYKDPENKRDEYLEVKDFLLEEGILITLTLTKDFADKQSDIIIERNFLTGKQNIRRVNGQQIKDKDFQSRLSALFYPKHKSEKPTFRQIISHNIRYEDESINNTLRTLSKYTTDVEYEALHLFLLGCDFDYGLEKKEIIEKINQEQNYRKRLESKQTKNAYEIALYMLRDEIKKLDQKKSTLNLNKDYEDDLNLLSSVKYNINKISSLISKLKIRKSLILETEKELNENVSKIDLQQLKMIYTQAKENMGGIQKTFEDLVNYHNNMIVEKLRFITQDLPELGQRINTEENNLKKELNKEKEITSRVTKGNSFKEIEDIISELNEKYKQQGEIENILLQLDEVESNLKKYNEKLKDIEKVQFNDEFEKILKHQLLKFNCYFSSISDELYGEKYALKYDKITKEKGNGEKVYKFSSFNTNMSSGKKQGEILCFDLAYILFADSEGIPCLHFLLNDKKELMHSNQLIKVAEFIEDKDIQLIISILKDKLPNELNSEEYIILRLSQDNKLFMIEQNAQNNNRK